MSSEAREELAELVRWIHSQGWASATAGNFSLVLDYEPLTLLMTPSSVDKGLVEPEDLLLMGDKANVLQGDGKASAEALIHVAIAQERHAKVIVHTHSVSNTLLSLLPEDFTIEGYELLKALEGIKTHEHSELIPILDNSQEMVSFSALVRQLLHAQPQIHCFLMRGHGLYTWGDSFFAAKRHLEALEFLFEVEANRRLWNRSG
ncbi:MAG TPA: methylthioribulose 1-phosphate dehydratase [Fimbriimonadaceae bacterium]|jgi:methylthioribulose-1-phosphate dehydratase